MKAIFYLLLLTFITQSCTDGLENMGEISLRKVSSNDKILLKETTIELKKGDVVELWNDMSFESRQKNKVVVNFGLEQYIDGKSRGGMQLDSRKTNPTIFGSKEMARGRMILSYQGKMAHIDILETGKYTFKAALFSSDEDLIVNRANLIFKRRT